MRRLLPVLTLLLGACAAPAALAPPSLLPAPASLQPEPGSFRPDRGTRVLLQPDSPELRALAELFAAPLRDASGFPLLVAPGSGPTRNAIVLRLAGTPAARGVFPDERYELSVTGDGVDLQATSPAGVARGLQSLRQLLPAGYERAVQRASAAAWQVPQLPPVVVKDWSIPAVHVSDSPRFPYRGLHLDVTRHFFPPSFVKQYIDLLALQRMSVFHWHLTDDQGWRIEIKQYPRLTEVGGCRRETMVARNFDPYIGDGTPHCGFYTQDEVKDIVAYAAARQITIIPEIEMPGHASAAIAAYTELSCEPGQREVVTTWGVFEPIFCPTEQTFTFLQNVLTEVIALFPSPYIHVGGDEAPKKMWQANATVQSILQREGLKDENELQSYFIRRMEQFLASHGRKLIGWDEILEGGIAPEATVMSWRGTAGGIEAAKQGHDVVMTPASHLYLDYYQGDRAAEPLAIGGFLPLEKVYSYEPVPAELSADEATHILGAQGNLWTEYIPTREQALYMAYPRAIALAEVAWSPAAAKNYDAFLQRLGVQLRRLDMLGIDYRIPDVQGLPKDATVNAQVLQLDLRSPHPDAQIRYTLDGSEPTAQSKFADEPFNVPVPLEGVTISVKSFLPNGRSSVTQVLKVGGGGK